jgi:arylsulfatase
LIIAGPGAEIKNIQKNTGMHVCDIFPTVLDLAGVSRPDNYNGNELAPLYGISVLKFLTGNDAMVRNTALDPLHFEMIECRAIIKGKWKAILLQIPYANEPVWQLYDLSTDPLEKLNLASLEPEKLQELINEWNEYARNVGYIQAKGEALIKKIGPVEFFKYESRSN